MNDPRPSRPLLLAAALVAPSLVSCQDQVLQPPEAEDAIFDRYVAVGNSITAGFQSAGISEETQRESYAVLLAERMGTDFEIPALRPPGCPPPITNPFTGERMDEAGDDACGLRRSPVPEVLNNVAVPGAATLDVFDNLDEDSNPNPLNPLILGGRTQAEAARAADPTFLTVWIGNNDALPVALTGTVTDRTLTPLGIFEDRYATAVEELEGAGEPEALLIGAVNPVFVPYLSFGAVYWQLHEAGAFPENFEVDASCSLDEDENGPETALVPFGYGFGELLLPAVADPELEVELNCAEDEQVLRLGELQQVTERVFSYNQAVAEEADRRDWAFVNPNAILGQLDQMQFIPPFPQLGSPTELFGPLFSLDGIHPNADLHRLAATIFVEVINDHYGTELDPPPGAFAGAADPAGAVEDPSGPVERALQRLPGLSRAEFVEGARGRGGS